MSGLDIEAIGARLRRARENKGLSRPQLADVLSMHPKTIENYETGSHSPLKSIGAIAKATDTNIRWLLHGTEEPPNAPEILQRIDDLDAKITDVQKEMRRQGVRRLGATAARKNDGGTGSKRPPKPKRPDESES